MRSKINSLLSVCKKSDVKNKAELLRIKSLFEGEQMERSRLGRELHDGIGGMLMALNRQLEELKSANASNSQDEIATIMSIANETSKELRNIIHNLIPESIVLHGLEESIKSYAAIINKNGALDIQLFTSGNWALVKTDTLLNIYRIVQELLLNIVKHASATIAAISLVINENKIELLIEDNGSGIIAPPQTEGNGLGNIRWRVAFLTGSMSVASAMGKGTIIHITLPYMETQPSQ